MINLLESRELLSLKMRLVNHETRHKCKKKEGKREWVLTLLLGSIVEHNSYLYFIILLYLFFLFAH